MDFREADIAQNRRTETLSHEWLGRYAVFNDDEGILIRNRAVTVPVVDQERVVMPMELIRLSPACVATFAVASKCSSSQQGKRYADHSPAQHRLVHIRLVGAIVLHIVRKDLRSVA